MTSAGKPGNGSPKPDGASVQAALLSPEICIVVVLRIIPKCWEKADGLEALEGSSPGCVMSRVFRTPPGSETGACAHRGNLGTRDSHLSPCRVAGS